MCDKVIRSKTPDNLLFQLPLQLALVCPDHVFLNIGTLFLSFFFWFLSFFGSRIHLLTTHSLVYDSLDTRTLHVIFYMKPRTYTQLPENPSY